MKPNEEVPSYPTYFTFPDDRRSEGACLVRDAVAQVMFNGKQRRAALNFESGKRKTCFLPSEESILERVCLHVRGKSDRGLHLTLKVQIPYARFEWEDSGERPQPDDFYEHEFTRIIPYRDHELHVPVIPEAEAKRELSEQAAEAGYDLAPETNTPQTTVAAKRGATRKDLILLLAIVAVLGIGLSEKFEPVRQWCNEACQKLLGEDTDAKNLTQD